MDKAIKVAGVFALVGIAAYLIINSNKDNVQQGPTKPTFRQAHTQGFRAQVAAAFGTSNVGRGGRRTVNGRSLRAWRVNDPVYGGESPVPGPDWGDTIPEPTIDPSNPTSAGPGSRPTRTGAGRRHSRT